MTQRRDGLFPGEAQVVARRGRMVRYRMDFPDGYGTMESHAIMPGVTLIINDFRTAARFPTEGRCPGLVEINHCRAGRFECTMRDGRVAWLGPQDFSVSDMGRPPLESRFSQGIYRGISLVLEPGEAGQALRGMLGEGSPDLSALFAGIFARRCFLVLRSERRIQYIFDQLYDVSEEERTICCKLMAAELMLFLRQWQRQVPVSQVSYCGRDLACRVREIAARMTADLRRHLPLEDLAREYGVGVTTLQRQFRQLYGDSPYAYLKRRRMEEAAFLLETTGQTVTQIAAAVGYQNASKFSAAFQDIYAMTPTGYKKAHTLE